MTLKRLIELYQAEQQGKQIMVREYRCGYLETYENIEEVEFSNCELSTLALENEEDKYGFSYTFFIKDEEDEYGCKLNEQNLQ